MSVACCLYSTAVASISGCNTYRLLYRMPTRKEVRWFTRGEFQSGHMDHDGDLPTNLDSRMDSGGPSIDQDSNSFVLDRRASSAMLLGSRSSIYSFTSSFIDATSAISFGAQAAPGPAIRERLNRHAPVDTRQVSTGSVLGKDIITIDGGPHTFWW